MCNNQVPYLYLPGFTGKGSTGSKNFFRPNVYMVMNAISPKRNMPVRSHILRLNVKIYTCSFIITAAFFFLK
jgi:hypothetical protein